MLLSVLSIGGFTAGKIRYLRITSHIELVRPPLDQDLGRFSVFRHGREKRIDTAQQDSNGIPSMAEAHETQHLIIKRRAVLRKGFVVGLLSFLVTGLGHVYIGRARRGFHFLAGDVLLTAFSFSSKLLFSPMGLAFIIVLGPVYKLAVIIDSVILNRKQGSFSLKSYNRLSVYIGVAVLAASLSMTVSSIFPRAKAFKIPGPSMSPALLPGDHILTDKWAYCDGAPVRGDVIVFRYPRDRQMDFVKRCTAIAGEEIELRNRDLFINGIRVEEPYAFFKDLKNTLPKRDNFGPYTVPEGQFFVLGDNRDNSNDSRFWGPVEREDIKGKVRIIYWSWDRENRAVRWGRIGKKVE